MNVVVPDEYKYLYVTDEDRPIVKIPTPVLREKAAEIPRVTKRHVVISENMIKIMKAARGIGLAAPQIGLSERIIVVAAEGKPQVMFNPVITSDGGTEVGEEGCLSIPGLYGDVERPATIQVEYLDKKNRTVRETHSGMSARVVLHEVDHLEGVLFTDKVDVSTLRWEHPSDRDGGE